MTDEARAAIEALCVEVDGWHVYETRDIGDAYRADAVQEFVADIRALFAVPPPYRRRHSLPGDVCLPDFDALDASLEVAAE